MKSGSTRDVQDTNHVDKLPMRKELRKELLYARHKWLHIHRNLLTIKSRVSAPFDLWKDLLHWFVRKCRNHHESLLSPLTPSSHSQIPPKSEGRVKMKSFYRRPVKENGGNPNPRWQKPEARTEQNHGTGLAKCTG